MPCVAHLGEVARHYDRIRAAGIDVIAVGHAPPAIVERFVERERIPFPVVTDPHREGYKFFNLGRVSVWHFLRPRILLNFIKLLFRGEKVRRLTRTEDVFQLGGDFLIDRKRTILEAYPSRDATDRPSVEAILKWGGGRPAPSE
jgi:peroxiredoxin